MVEINLTWQAASVFSASLLLSALFLGGMINPRLKTSNNCELCLVCPTGDDMLFQNGAAFVYHLICFLHFGGMAAGLAGLAFSLVIGSISEEPGDYLKAVFAFPLPIIWVVAWATHLAVLADGPGWKPYNAEDKDANGNKLVPPTIGLWWAIFAVLFLGTVTLVVTSGVGLMNDTYTQLQRCPRPEF